MDLWLLQIVNKVLFAKHDYNKTGNVYINITFKRVYIPTVAIEKKYYIF
jgi:hypothetical protein